MISFQAQRLHKEHGLGRLIEAGGGEPQEAAGAEAGGRHEAPTGSREDLEAALEALEAAKTRLDRVLGRC